VNNIEYSNRTVLLIVFSLARHKRLKHNVHLCRRCHVLPPEPIHSLAFIFMKIQLEILAQQVVQRYKTEEHNTLEQLLTTEFHLILSKQTKYRYNENETDMLKILIIKEWMNVQSMLCV
jgi:hypothetical protein